MRRLMPLLLLCALATGGYSAWRLTASDDDARYRITRKIPHDPRAYTQGLLYHDDSLYESTGLYGESTLRRLNPADGSILRLRPLPTEVFGEGLALFDERLIQLTWRAGRAFVYDLNDFDPRGEFGYDSEGWGLTHDGQLLVMSDGSARLYFRDPHGFRLLRTVTVTENGHPVERLNELEFINGEIWANIYLTSDIVRIDPTSGAVRERLDFSDLPPPSDRHGNEDVLNGIAYDHRGDRLFLTGKRYAYIYEIELR
jgi:glutamine cyclotransferase